MIDKFEEWIPFTKNNDVSNDEIIKFHTEFIKKYPEFRNMKLESDFYNKTKYWTYSLNTTIKDIEVEIFLEISKKTNWSFTFELISKSNKNETSFTQEEKVFEKNNIDWEELNFNLQKVVVYIRNWNRDFEKEIGVSLFKK